VKILAVIPARSGSKGVVNKNIREVCGKSLIRIAYDASEKSGIFDDIYLASDSHNYFKSLINTKVKIFHRQSNLTEDESTIADLMSEMWDIINNYDIFCLLQPTSPLRTHFHIKEAYKQYISSNKTTLASVCKVKYKPELLYCNVDNENVKLIDNSGSNRQSYKTYYQLNGAIYFCDKKRALEGKLIDTNPSLFEMSEDCSLDIDEEKDFMKAESLMNKI